MTNRISNDRTENKEKVDQSRVNMISCGQCDRVYIGRPGRDFSTRMKKQAQSGAKKDDKSLSVRNCNDEGQFSETSEQEFETLHTEYTHNLTGLSSVFKFLFFSVG